MTREPRQPLLQFQKTRVLMPARGHCAFLDNESLDQSMPFDPTKSALGLVIFRAASGLCGIMPAGLVVYKSGRPVGAISVLHHGDELNIAGIEADYRDIVRVVIEAGDPLLERDCRYCGYKIILGDAIVVCPLCGEGYHEKCWPDLYGKACLSRNCSFAPGPFLPPTEGADPRLVLAAAGSRGVA